MIIYGPGICINQPITLIKGVFYREVILGRRQLEDGGSITEIEDHILIQLLDKKYDITFVPVYDSCHYICEEVINKITEAIRNKDDDVEINIWDCAKEAAYQGEELFTCSSTVEEN